MDDDVITQDVDVSDVVDQMQEVAKDQEAVKEQQVPLSALQKERRKRQELELQVQWEQQRNKKPTEPIDDSSKYESATKEDLGKSQTEAIRIIEEKLWIKANPEKYEMINTNLPEFLKQRPNLTSAIQDSSNRWEEAFTLMEALTPRQQQQLKQSVIKKDAPNAPTGVPKSASMNAAVDVMSMNDTEYTAWRSSQKKRR